MKNKSFYLLFFLFWLSFIPAVAQEPFISDFQVSESGGPNFSSQIESSNATDSNGNYIVTWSDTRNSTYDIYAQRYLNDGTPIGNNFRVNDDEGNRDQRYSSISVDGNGNFIITWQDKRDDDKADIYAQRYLSNGTTLGSNFKVNDDEGSEYQFNPSVATAWNGNFIITWHDLREGNEIYAQRFLSDGTAVGSNFRVSDDPSRAHIRPSIAADSIGHFFVTWETLGGAHLIYAQIYLNDGTTVGNNFVVDGNFGYNPSIDVDLYGNFIITWWGGDNNGRNIYAKRFRHDGTALGSRFIVNDITSLMYPLFSSISVSGNGDFVISWIGGPNEIDAQRFMSDGLPIGSNFKVNDDTLGISVGPTSISTDSNGNFIITWNDNRNENNDIYAQRFLNDGTFLGSNIQINEDFQFAYQYFPSIAVDESGNFIVTWYDDRNGNYDIYAQRYLNDGTILGSNFKVNDDTGGVNQYSPSISIDVNGSFVVTWFDERNGDWDVYAQRYLNDGTTLGTNFKVNDDIESAYQSDPSVAMYWNGNFIVTWMDDRDDFYGDIYAQRYSSSGTPIGDNFKVNDDNEGAYQRYPSVFTDINGNFVITWDDKRNGNYDIYGQIYLSGGIKVGTNFQVNNDSTNSDQYFPSISGDESGNFIIGWHDKRNGDDNRDIYIQRYLSDGTPLGSNLKVNEDGGNTNQWYVSISSDESGNFIVTWRDELNGNSDIYAQLFLSDGTLLGNNFRVTNTNEREQFSPDVKLWNNRIYNTWRDNRIDGAGFDIWANVLEWENPMGISDDQPHKIPLVFGLCQNYPNPFNSSTRVTYSISNSAFVTLKVYDILGREIKNLVSEFQKPGIYSINFDASKISSGVYFYKLQVGSDFIETRKMLLMR